MTFRTAEVVVCNEPGLDVATWWWQLRFDGEVAAESRRMTQPEATEWADRLAKRLEVETGSSTAIDSPWREEWPVLPADASDEVLLIGSGWELIEGGQVIAAGWADKPRQVKEVARWLAGALDLPLRQATEADQEARNAEIVRRQREAWQRQRELAQREGPLGVIDIREHHRAKRPKDLVDLLRRADPDDGVGGSN